MQIPSFILKKLYIKGSLKNAGDGFEFKLKNSLSPGTAVALDPIKIDGKEYPLTDLTISSEGTSIKGSEISAGNAFPIKVGVEIVLHVRSPPLPKGDHKIDIAIATKEVGKLAFDVSDLV